MYDIVDLIDLKTHVKFRIPHIWVEFEESSYYFLFSSDYIFVSVVLYKINSTYF